MLQNNACRLAKKVLRSNLLNDDDTAYIVYDLEKVERRFWDLKEAFPENTLHAIAVKACPLPYMLKLQEEHGLGAEAASLEEVLIALHSGIPAHKIIFDGPAKTNKEIDYCVKNGIYINIDSFEELDRVQKIARMNSSFKAGIRLNPQIGMGGIGDTSVAGKASKFGVSLTERGEEIKEAFRRHDWLVGVHVHIGSQGMSLNELVAGTKKTFEFCADLEGLERFDMGGGLPVVYKEDDPEISFREYASALKEEIPQLFEGDLRILTEFGRRVYADTAVAITQIEYVKNQNQIVCHLGADMFLRRVYKPMDWHHRFSVLDKDGDALNSEEKKYDIAGPLCFGGDFLAKGALLPEVKEKDLLAVHDVGAYTLSMWSRHCSRFTPKVLGVDDDGVKVVKKREGIEDLISFWS